MPYFKNIRSKYPKSKPAKKKSITRSPKGIGYVVYMYSPICGVSKRLMGSWFKNTR